MRSTRLPTLRFVAAAVLLLTAASAQALTLGVLPFDEVARLHLDTTPAPHLQLVGVDAGMPAPFTSGDLLFDVDLTTASPGSLFVVDAATPGFDAVATRLTNGVDDLLFWIIPGDWVAAATPESFLLASVLGPGEVDLADFALERIELRIDDLGVVDNPPAPPPLVFPTDEAFASGTLTFVGTPVPEPSTAGLLAVGALGLAVTRRRHRGEPRAAAWSPAHGRSGPEAHGRRYCT